MKSERGAGYVTVLPSHRYWLLENLSDNRQHPERSKTKLFENEKPLGPSHSLHQAIRNEGQGRFSHWHSTLYFSTSDNSDPRTNGRSYKVSVIAATPIWLLVVFGLSLLISSYLNRRIVSMPLVRAVPWQTIFSCLLAAAALGWGIWTRLLFFRSFPDPLPTPDTWAYVTGAYSLLEKGRFDLASIRPPGFPLLIWLTFALFKSFAALNVINGALTLFSALAIAFAVRAFGGPWRMPAVLAAGFVAVHPHILFWEHFVMTEASFQAFFVLALGATALVILRPTPGGAVIAGMLAAIAVLIREQGIFLVPLILFALAWAARRLGRRKLLWTLVAAGAGPLILLGGWSARNAAVHGFFGLSSFGPLQLFGVSARWVDLDSSRFAADKALIAESIRHYRAMPDDPRWVKYSPEGPVALLNRKYGIDDEFLAALTYSSNVRHRDQALNALAREAILHQPRAFIGRGLDIVAKLVTQRVTHEHYTFDGLAHYDEDWKELGRWFPVDQHRAALDQTRFPLADRERTFIQRIIPAFAWETPFIRMSLGMTLLALLALPLLSGPRRLAAALAAISVVLLITTAGFLSVAVERYLAVIHGSAALAGALAVAGLLERWLPGVE
ncbi:MAG TPA: glycosyltransferase family 39 protein [Candidatus Binatia bacterium]